MKKIFFLFFVMIVSLPVRADRTPLIMKHNSTGFVPQEWVRIEKCEIFENKILVTKTYGEASVTFQIPLSSDPSLNEMIMRASQETLEEEINMMCDGPTTVIESDGILLYSTGGCGSPKKHRQGPFSYALMHLIGTFCPDTH